MTNEDKGQWKWTGGSLLEGPKAIYNVNRMNGRDNLVLDLNSLTARETALVEALADVVLRCPDCQREDTERLEGSGWEFQGTSHYHARTSPEGVRSEWLCPSTDANDKALTLLAALEERGK